LCALCACDCLLMRRRQGTVVDVEESGIAEMSVGARRGLNGVKE
jgi:hypothetical protein